MMQSARLLGLACVGAVLTLTTAEECYSETEWRSQSLTNLSGAFARCGPSLVCVEGHPGCEDFCTQSEECSRYPFNVCSGASAKCEHKALFAEIAGPDVGTAILFFFISGLALSAGIGGGGLYVPLLSIMLGFSVREATALSQACLAGGASTALLYNLRQRHPSGEKPMIDYDLVLIMGPTLLAGAILGSILNASAPTWLILLLLIVVLTHSAGKAFEKAIKAFRKESKGDSGLPRDARLSKNPIDRCLRFLRGERQQPAAPPASAPVQQVAKKPTQEATAEPVNAIDVDVDITAACQTPKSRGVGETPAPEAEASEPGCAPACAPASPAHGAAESEAMKQPQFPLVPLALFGTIWLIVLVSIFARGGRATSGLVPYCSVGYWGLALLTAGVLLSISLLSARRTIAAHAQADGDAEAENDNSPTSTDPLGAGAAGFQWSERGTATILGWSLLAGTLAAMCGIGGGMVMGPRLLDLGFSPQVQSATTATTLFVMSTSTCLAYLVEGVAPGDYVVWLAFATGSGAVVGKTIVGWLVKKFRRPSIIMFLLAGIISTSVIVMSLTAVFDVANDIREGQDMGFKSPCHEG